MKILKKAKKNCKFIMFTRDHAVKAGPEANQVGVIVKDSILEEIWESEKTPL